MADDDLLMTRADYEKLEAEIEELETCARGEMAERIKAARELGDLKENAEYHDAKDAQAILETRILRLRDQLARAQVVEAEAGGDAIAFGSEFEVADRASGKRTTYTLVSAVDADAAAGRLERRVAGRPGAGGRPGRRRRRDPHAQGHADARGHLARLTPAIAT